VSELQTVHLLNRPDVDVDDVGKKKKWLKLLERVICSPVGRESLSIHYWRLLDMLVSASGSPFGSDSRNMGLVRLLGEAERWRSWRSGL